MGSGISQSICRSLKSQQRFVFTKKIYNYCKQSYAYIVHDCRQSMQNMTVKNKLDTTIIQLWTWACWPSAVPLLPLQYLSKTITFVLHQPELQLVLGPRPHRQVRFVRCILQLDCPGGSINCCTLVKLLTALANRLCINYRGPCRRLLSSIVHYWRYWRYCQINLNYLFDNLKI